MNLIDFLKLFGKTTINVYNYGMETIEIFEKPNEIATNQIAFDLDNLPLEEQLDEEESSSLPETALSPNTIEWVKEEVLFVIVKNDGDKSIKNYRTQICGRPMMDWVLMATSGCETKYISNNDNIIETIKYISTQKPYMFVVYSDTPLIYKNLLLRIMDYFSRNRLNALTLLRGYVFKTSFLKDIDNFILTCLEKFDETAFLQVKDTNSFAKATKIMQNRILDYHEKNGVVIFDRNNTVIDADVEIDNDVVIMANNCLKGSCVIGRGVILREQNVVANSIIGEETNLLACRIFDSNVAGGKTLVGVDILNEKY